MPDSDPPKVLDSDPSRTPAQAKPSQDGNIARIFALVFAFFAIACVLAGSYYVKQEIIDQKSIVDALGFPDKQDSANFYITKAAILVIEKYTPLLLISLFALFFVRASVRFVKSSEYTRTGVVPPLDIPFVEEAIRQGKPEPIDQYIRLASLTGGVGLFQKVGLTGLPLTTLALVVFFAFGVMFFDNKGETFKAFLDFEKLTLGAFIGSFVQRQVERRGQESDIQRAIQTFAAGSAGEAAAGSAGRIKPL